MSKRLICLFLSLTMLLGVFLTGCGNKSTDEAIDDKVEQASESARTLAMYLMSEKPVSAETAQKIEDALNDITEKKYTIRMQLYFYTEAEYYEKLEKAFADRATAEANGTLKEDKVTEGEENKTVLDEYGKVQIVYPTIADYQVDLFYLGGKDKFDEYAAAGKFRKIKDQLESSIADQQFKFMPQHYFDYEKALNGGTHYAVANAKAIGQYTYLLLNKEALAAASRSKEDGFTALTAAAVQDFLSYVSDEKSGLTEKFYPLYTNLDRKELLFNNVQFMGVGADGKISDAFSILGGYLEKAAMDSELTYTNMYTELSNLMDNEKFLSEMEALVKYEQNGYYSTNEASGKEFAVGYVTGGAELALTYGEQYEMIPVGMPTLTEDELYEDMFAVCSYTTDVSKSMQIMTLINTDEEVRNLLLYGIEDEHYQLVDSDLKDEFGEHFKLAERLNEDYVMSAARTGNTLITIPEKLSGAEAAFVIPNIKEYMVQQNLDAVINLTSGFQPTYGNDKQLTALENFIKDEAETAYKEAQAATTKADKAITTAETNLEKAKAALEKAKADGAFSVEIAEKEAEVALAELAILEAKAAHEAAKLDEVAKKEAHNAAKGVSKDAILATFNAELQIIRTLSEKIWAKYEECTTVEQFAAFKLWLAEEMVKDEYRDANGVLIIEKHVGYKTEDGKPAHWHDGEIEACNGLLRCKTHELSLACLYHTWLKEMDMKR